MKKLVYVAFVAMFIISTTVSAAKNTSAQKESKSQQEIAALRAQIKTLTAGNAEIAKNLQTFDTLDYTVFSNQQWVRLHESHAKDIKVNWPDGHFTIGIERHIADLKYMFVYAPDTKIKIHPIRFGSGNMTCVTGVMTGTFTLPMPIGDGKFIQPTGKTFSLPMCTVGIWKDGMMIEEYLFWDNQTYMNQLGLGK
ncbi:MAG: ester cyclase [Paludibacter sp.]|nr:ester cyclase [Paludibacter sp.]